MIISDLSIRRPVFAMVISLMLVILGLASLSQLPVRQYPDIDPPVVSIGTTYRGASAEVIETKITQVIEDRIAGLEGIDKLSSRSRDERSDIRIEFSLDRDIDAAANDVRDRVSRIVGNLPEEAEAPEISKADNDTRSVMWINLTAPRMSNLELTDYAERYLVDRFSTVPGVARVSLYGSRQYAMRIWLDRQALAAHGLSVAEVESALRSENVELPAGRMESTSREFTLRTNTGYSTAEDFRRLVIGRGAGGELVRLAEVADVRLGASNDRNIARTNGETAISLGIEQLSKANSVDVSHGVRRVIDSVQEDLPEGMDLSVNYDRADFIESSMKEVFKALVVAIVLVLVVIYLFLGSLRATLIPALVVPVSIIASFMVMGALGFTINILTLLGLVLAIGLVVDDAIIVLENIYRRIEQDQPVLLAALDGSREIGFAVIATTLVLVAVFIPLSFIQGEVGRLFGEFGITLAAAVLFSSLVALTLTPMMCTKLFRTQSRRSRLSGVVDRFFRKLASRYKNGLARCVRHPWMVLLAAGLVTVAALTLLLTLPSEYTPDEDQGIFRLIMQGPEGASLEYTNRYAEQMEAIMLPEVHEGSIKRVLTRLPADYRSTGEVNSARATVILHHWDERDEHVSTIAARVRPALAALPGVQARVSVPQGFGIGGQSQPVQLVLGGPDYEQLQEWRDLVLKAIEEMPQVVDADSDYQERKPQLRVSVDRDRAAALGVSLADIGRTLETMLGSRVVTTFVNRGREYNVIVQGEDDDRSSPDDLTNLYVRSTTTRQLIPLQNLVRLEEVAGPAQLNRFDRLRAITISAEVGEGYRLGEALDVLEQKAREILPSSARISWDGGSREFRQTGSSLYGIFGLAMIIVFMVLAGQFESFRHPLIIMGTVPLALTGALLGVWILGSSINVYTQIGAVLLIGLAAKNGVLIVEFANQLRDRGVEFEASVVEAASIRLRPILMTSACTTLGAMPLLLAVGAGAESRQPIGIVVVFGVAISALLTLFVIPALYVLLARGSRSPQYVSRLIEKLKLREQPET